MTELLGESVCLTAAFLWAAAVTAFREPIATHGARAVNLAKCLVATVLLAATVAVLGGWSEILAAPRATLLVAASGLVGLTLGDTALFAAVTRVGVHRALLLQTLAPLFTAAVAVPLGERLGPGEVVGGLVVLAGVALVVKPSRTAAASRLQPAVGWAGFSLGVLSAAGQGVGVVIAKAGLDDLGDLEAAMIRLLAATAGLVAVGAVTGSLGRATRLATDVRALRRVLPASFFGTYLTMVLMMAGIRLAPASVAAVLLATSPVFGLVLEAVLRRRWPDATSVVGTLVAVAGVALLTGG